MQEFIGFCTTRTTAHGIHHCVEQPSVMLERELDDNVHIVMYSCPYLSDMRAESFGPKCFKKWYGSG